MRRRGRLPQATAATAPLLGEAGCAAVEREIPFSLVYAADGVGRAAVGVCETDLCVLVLEMLLAD
jgi:hypothetical protein